MSWTARAAVIAITMTAATTVAGCGTTPATSAAPTTGTPAPSENPPTSGSPSPSPSSVEVLPTAPVVAGDCALPAPHGTAPDVVTTLGLLPDGAVITTVEQRDGGRTVITATAPTPFTELLDRVRAGYTAHGLTQLNGEAENGDAESDFTGQGYKGRWGLRQVNGCPTNTTISVVVAKDG